MDSQGGCIYRVGCCQVKTKDKQKHSCCNHPSGAIWDRGKHRNVSATCQKERRWNHHVRTNYIYICGSGCDLEKVNCKCTGFRWKMSNDTVTWSQSSKWMWNMPHRMNERKTMSTTHQSSISTSITNSFEAQKIKYIYIIAQWAPQFFPKWMLSLCSLTIFQWFSVPSWCIIRLPLSPETQELDHKRQFHQSIE